ncbi:XRE family transcriptional regulator [Aquabacterium sp. A7-Y]|uniref:LexA family transcriptional regulator n=1 Tax=Aquabacterium sp. A7-Y TaxID=1349605 RepID=UPI00223D8510|nr:XRE family transcriptional regulator [Aquabacterium sp. A7-Y]MCW7541465.1 XRE family transcriptional regulator [Aquabacterium sp. A7-Y]
MQYGERLQLALNLAGQTRDALAKALGVSVQSIGLVINGQTKAHTAENCAKAAAFLRVNFFWLATGVGEPRPAGGLGELNADPSSPSGITSTTREAPPIDLDNNYNYPAVPLVKFKLAAGVSGFGVEYLDREANPIVFRKDWYESRGLSPKRLYATTVSGQSMEPGLWEGDTVVVNTEDTRPADGCVFAINYEGELVIKRLMRDEGAWWLVSDHADQRRYPRKRCHDQTFILGRIVHKQSERL